MAEKVPTTVYGSALEAVGRIAADIAAAIRDAALEGRPLVLGLATGSTPVPLYDELIRLHRQEGLSFSNVVSFNLDEYYPIAPDHRMSYHFYMRNKLFEAVGLDDGQIYIPDGQVPKDELSAYCQAYEDAIRESGGIDIQILGIGRTGHIGFNEPGSGFDSKTRLVELDALTRADAAADFCGIENVPRCAVTMGVSSIMAAKKIYLMAWGEGKAEVVRRAVEGPQSELLPASFLQSHPDAQVVLDTGAGSRLSRAVRPDPNWAIAQ